MNSANLRLRRRQSAAVNCSFVGTSICSVSARRNETWLRSKEPGKRGGSDMGWSLSRYASASRHVGNPASGAQGTKGPCGTPPGGRDPDRSGSASTGWLLRFVVRLSFLRGRRKYAEQFLALLK